MNSLDPNEVEKNKVPTQTQSEKRKAEEEKGYLETGYEYAKSGVNALYNGVKWLTGRGGMNNNGQYRHAHKRRRRRNIM